MRFFQNSYSIRVSCTCRSGIKIFQKSCNPCPSGVPHYVHVLLVAIIPFPFPTITMILIMLNCFTTLREHNTLLSLQLHEQAPQLNFYLLPNQCTESQPFGTLWLNYFIASPLGCPIQVQIRDRVHLPQRIPAM